MKKESTFFPPFAKTLNAVAFLSGLNEAVPNAKDKSAGNLLFSNPNLSAYALAFSTPNSLNNLIDTKFLLCNKPSLNLVGP